LGALEEFLLDALVIFLPAAIGEGSHVVVNEAIILSVKLGGCVGVACAPGGAVIVHELSEGGIVGELLLSSCSDKCEQCADQRQCDIKTPMAAVSAGNDRLRDLAGHQRHL